MMRSKGEVTPIFCQKNRALCTNAFHNPLAMGRQNRSRRKDILVKDVHHLIIAYDRRLITARSTRKCLRRGHRLYLYACDPPLFERPMKRNRAKLTVYPWRFGKSIIWTELEGGWVR